MTITINGVNFSGGMALSSFMPSDLFAVNATGVLYDPSDLTSMRQDSAGTTSAVIGSSVGFIADKSFMGGSSVAAFTSAQPELVTNGNFNTDTDWSKQSGWTISGGVASYASTGFNAISQSAPWLVEGLTYIISFEIVSYTSGSVSLQVGTSGGSAINSGAKNAVGVYSAIGVFPVGANKSVLCRAENGFTGSIDNISVKLLPGNHATQSTSSQRPILGRNPITGTRNLLTYTEQFDNAAWLKFSANVITDSAVAPNGTTTADKLIPDTAINTHGLGRAITGIYSSGGTVMFSVRVKADPYAFVGVAMYDQPSYSCEVRATFNLTNLTSSTSILGTGVTEVAASITDIGNDWRLLTVTGKFAAGTGVYPSILVNPTNSNVFGTGSAGNGVGGTLVWGAQLETGSTATAYQKVVSQYDVTETGVTDAYYLAFDGSDDWMITNTITPGIDKAQVFAGVRKLSDAATASVIGTSTAPFGNNGCIELYAPLYGNGYGFGARGTTWSDLSSSGTPAPDQAVITGISDIVSPSIRLRRNGVNIVSNTFTQGTGNFLAYPLYIGRRGGTSGPFNGRIYALIVRFGGNLDSTIISDTETWVNSKTGAY